MILDIFTWLSNALSGNPAIALSASFLWGILSIILSPCHLASIPLIVGFIDDQGNIKTKRAFLLSFLFALGILITIAIIGVITSAMGRIAGDIGRWGNYFVAGIFFIVGLYLVGVIPLSFSGPAQVEMKRKGSLASFMLGLFFGIALGPCTFAYMAPVLGAAFTVSRTNVVYAAVLVLTYAIGHCSVIVFAGTFTEVVQRYLDWNERSKGSLILKRVCGILVIAGGIYLLFSV
ncbi:MAG: cytochrome c biogenesis protein CcdA [Candidatus Omnitrophota bacterium]